MKRTALALTLIVSILVLTIVAVTFAGILNPAWFNNPDQTSLFIASFSRVTVGSKVTGGNIVLVNPTDKSFENLTLTIKIDDSELIAPILGLWIRIPDEKLNDTFPITNYTIPITQMSIEPRQNETIKLLLFDPDQNEPLYVTSVDVQTYSSHVFRFYITQNIFGDVINGQSLTIPQEKAYLQILGYSSIEHSSDTWHEYYNSVTNRYEYVNDQPNFCQRYHYSAGAILDSDDYRWAESLNGIKEHYFNVTVFSNNTFPVGTVALYGAGGVVSALGDKVLLPNETYLFPVPTFGGNWRSADNVYQLSRFNQSSVYASGDLISKQE